LVISLRGIGLLPTIAARSLLGVTNADSPLPPLFFLLVVAICISSPTTISRDCALPHSPRQTSIFGRYAESHDADTDLPAHAVPPDAA
jgi:hypothetical protein